MQTFRAAERPCAAEQMRKAKPEYQLIAACARPNPTPALAEEIRALAAGVVDWDGFVQAALRHGVMPLVWRHLARIEGAPFPPPPVRNHLETLYYKNAARNAYLTEQMFHVLDLLLSAGLRVAPFKGPVLAASLYGDPALRQFDDLDFIVHQADIRRARQVLLDHGFRPYLHLSEAQAEAHLRAGWEILFRSAAGDYTLELDTGVAPDYFAFGLGPERLWQGFEVVRLADREVRTLSPENLLLLLSAHGAKHLWRRLLWVSDFARLAARQEISWDRVIARARNLGALRMLALALILARDVLTMEAPPDCPSSVWAEPGAERLAAQVVSSWFTPAPRRYPRLENVLFHILARERLRDRGAYLWRLAVTPSYSDWKGLPLPKPLFFVYRFTRPFRVAWKLLRLARNASVGEPTTPSP